MSSRASLKWLFLCAWLISGLSEGSAGDTADRPVVDWLRSHATPLKTVDAGHGFDDMQPLKKVIGDARIVELGEATHGSREFFQLKHRVVEFLASQMGFTIFSIEANMPEAYRLNDFVLNGNGDPKQLLKGMYFWTWNTQEVLDMILWMREFNRSGKGHIEFTGFDMQTPTVAMDIVRSFVAVHDNLYDIKLRVIYQGLARPAQTEPQRSVNETVANQLLVTGSEEVLEHLQSNRDNYLRAGSTPESVDWVIQNVRIILQSVQLKAKEKLRDQSMAENIEWIADQNPDAKIVIWAHNGHVAYGGFPGYKPMGAYLRAAFDKQLVNFGFAFNEGSFQAVEPGKGLHDFTVGPAPEGSLDRVFADSGIPIFALDLRPMPKEGPVADWFGKPHITRSIGALYQDSYRDSYFMNARPQDQFDAMFFVEKTSAGTRKPLKSGSTRLSS